MPETAFTPGPWVAAIYNDYAFISKVDDEGKIITSIETGLVRELEANAVLMAAAPDYHAAWQAFTDAALDMDWGIPPELIGAVHMMNAAHKKATEVPA